MEHPPAAEVTEHQREERKTFHDRTTRILKAGVKHDEQPTRLFYIYMLRAATVNYKSSQPKHHTSKLLTKAFSTLNINMEEILCRIAYNQEFNSPEAQGSGQIKASEYKKEIEEMDREIKRLVSLGEK